MAKKLTKKQQAAIREIAEALAFGPAKLDLAGLKSYLAAVEHDLAMDQQYGRSTTKNSRYVAAGKLAIELATEAARLDAFDAYRARNHGIEQDAVLRWIDATSGEGMIRLADGTSLSAHFTAIEGVDKNNYHWPTDADQGRLGKLGYNVPIRVVPYITYGMCTAEKIVIIAGI